MSYANRKQLSQNRTTAIILSALFTFVIGFTLATGLAYNVVKQAAEDLKTFDVEDEPPPPETPPPPPKDLPPPPPDIAVPPSQIRIELPSQNQLSTTTDLSPKPITMEAKPQPPATKTCPDGQTILAALACAPVKSQAASAKANLSSYVSNDDYPSSAIRNSEQGTTGFVLTVGPDGRVSDCAISSSSGSSSLDSTTCNLMKRRARFTPAKSSDGSPTTDRVSGRIRWVLPED